MTKVIITCVSILLLAACSNPRRVEQLPPIKSPDTSSKVFLKHTFPAGPGIHRLTFKLDNAPIYRFGDTRQFSFYLDTGDYTFGYSHGSEDCETSVHIGPSANYVFELGPECHIELISE
ncbi:MAG: hypothetical protein ABFS24_07330 [Pseudomonadota bacterium]